MAAPTSSRFALLLVLVAALIVRLPLLHFGLWRDEAAVFVETAPARIQDMLALQSVMEWQPPLYFLLIFAWSKIFGTHELALRLPSLCFGLGAIVLSYAAARSAAGRTAGIFAASIGALSTFALAHFVDVRAYALAALLAAAFAASYLAYYRRPDPPRLAAIFLTGVALVYTHYVGLVLIAGFVCAALGRFWSTREKPAAHAAAAGTCALLSLSPRLPALMHEHDLARWWAVPTTLPDRLLHFASALFGAIYPIDPEWPVDPQTLIISRIVTIVAGSVALMVIVRMARRQRTIAGLCTALIAGVLFASGLGLAGRYLTPLVPLEWIVYGIAFGRIVEHLAPRRARLAAGATALVALASPALDVDRLVSGNEKTGVRAYAIRHAGSRERFAVIAVPDYLGPSAGYYLRGRNIPIYTFPRWKNGPVWITEGYPQAFNSADVLHDDISALRALWRSGTHRVDVVKTDISHPAQLRTEYFSQFLAVLDRHCRLRTTTGFPGMFEPVTVFTYERCG